jgi:hypothetical protein|tara:strand:+ start:12064 stop:12636 length:573 start_codon:yes stop_codon:yes gene_type:complete
MTEFERSIRQAIDRWNDVGSAQGLILGECQNVGCRNEDVKVQVKWYTGQEYPKPKIFRCPLCGQKCRVIAVLTGPEVELRKKREREEWLRSLRIGLKEILPGGNQKWLGEIFRSAKPSDIAARVANAKKTTYPLWSRWVARMKRGDSLIKDLLVDETMNLNEVVLRTAFVKRYGPRILANEIAQQHIKNG